MIDLTANLVKHLDLARAIGAGVNTECVPLIHAVERGYSALSIPFPGGWSLEDGDIETLQILVIAEQEWVTADLLRQANGFSIGGLVFEIVGTRISSPSPGAVLREWKFTVAPTGEEFAV